MKYTIIGDIEDPDGREVLEDICSLPYEDLGIPICVGDIYGPKKTLPSNLIFIYGNHDDPLECEQHKGFVGSWKYSEKEKILFISGAEKGHMEWSDRWNSELSFPDTFEICERIKSREIQPTLVISHTAPTFYLKTHFKASSVRNGSKTSDCLERIADTFFASKIFPKHWIHGHIHHHREMTWYKRIKFTSLGKAQTMTLEI